jgi:hypothetical protein
MTDDICDSAGNVVQVIPWGSEVRVRIQKDLGEFVEVKMSTEVAIATALRLMDAAHAVRGAWVDEPCL